MSYRDVEESLAERGITVDHVTIYRWVQLTPLLIDAARLLGEVALSWGSVPGVSGLTAAMLIRIRALHEHLADTPDPAALAA